MSGKRLMGPLFSWETRRRGLHVRRESGAGAMWRIWAPLGLLVSLAVLFATLWPRTEQPVDPSAFPSVLTAGGGPRGPVSVEGISARSVWTAAEDSLVTVTLHKALNRPVDAQVWWLISRLGDTQPWRDPLLASAHRMVQFRSTQRSESVSFPSVAPLPPDGAYTLSAWVHTSVHNRHAFAHSDGVSLATSILVARQTPGLLVTRRVNYPVSIVRMIGDSRASADRPLTVVLANGKATVELLQLSVTIHGAANYEVSESRTISIGGPTVQTYELQLPGRSRGPTIVTAEIDQLLPNGLHQVAERVELFVPYSSAT